MYRRYFGTIYNPVMNYFRCGCCGR